VPDVGPIEVSRTIGVGHSMGGMLAIYQQSLHGNFDPIAPLGYGTIEPIWDPAPELGKRARLDTQPPRRSPRLLLVRRHHPVVLPRSAHCHNSAGTRHVLWDRLARWIGAEVRIGTRFEPPSPEPDDPVLATPMTWNVRPMA
jgi:hypothetical protein